MNSIGQYHWEWCAPAMAWARLLHTEPVVSALRAVISSRLGSGARVQPYSLTNGSQTRPHPVRGVEVPLRRFQRVPSAAQRIHNSYPHLRLRTPPSTPYLTFPAILAKKPLIRPQIPPGGSFMVVKWQSISCEWSLYGWRDNCQPRAVSHICYGHSSRRSYSLPPCAYQTAHSSGSSCRAAHPAPQQTRSGPA